MLISYQQTNIFWKGLIQMYKEIGKTFSHISARFFYDLFPFLTRCLTFC